MEKTRIHLTKNLYDINAIKSSLDDYKHICDGKIIDDSFLLELNPKKNIPHLKEEFCNHVLAYMKG